MPKDTDSANEPNLAAKTGVSSRSPGNGRRKQFNWTVSTRNPLHKICRALSLMSAVEYADAVSHGVPVALIGQISEATSCSVRRLSPMLGIPRTTVYRMQAKGVVSMAHFEGDAIADFARLLGEAQANAGQARQALTAAGVALVAWLYLPNASLGGVAPATIMKVGVGRAQVFRLRKRLGSQPLVGA